MFIKRELFFRYSVNMSSIPTFDRFKLNKNLLEGLNSYKLFTPSPI